MNASDLLEAAKDKETDSPLKPAGKNADPWNHCGILDSRTIRE